MQSMENTSYSLFSNEFTRNKRIIYTASSFARSSLFYLQEIGMLSALKPHVSSRKNLSSFLFFLVKSGSGTLKYQENTYILVKGDGVFIDCTYGYEIQSSDHRDVNGEYDKLWSLEWIHFNGVSMKSVMDKYVERGGLPVFLFLDSYETIYRDLFEIASSDSYVRDAEIAEKLMTLIRTLLAEAWEMRKMQALGMIAENRGKKRNTVSMEDIREYIQGHYSEKISLSSISEVFFYTKEHLSKRFKAEYGFTVNGYIAQVRISKAKNLLRFSDLTIEQIGISVGIEDANYFTRMFKRVEGIAPSEYRKSW